MSPVAVVTARRFAELAEQGRIDEIGVRVSAGVCELHAPLANTTRPARLDPDKRPERNFFFDDSLERFSKRLLKAFALPATHRRGIQQGPARNAMLLEPM